MRRFASTKQQNLSSDKRILGIIPQHARAGRSWQQLRALGDPLPRRGCMARHSRAGTLCMLQGVVTGPHEHNMVSSSHGWGQSVCHMWARPGYAAPSCTTWAWEAPPGTLASPARACRSSHPVCAGLAAMPAGLVAMPSPSPAGLVAIFVQCSFMCFLCCFQLGNLKISHI